MEFYVVWQFPRHLVYQGGKNVKEHYKPAPLIIAEHYHFIVYPNENEHPICFLDLDKE